MESTTLHHPGWAAAPSSASSDPFSQYQHDKYEDVYSVLDQTTGLPHLLNPNSLSTTDASKHNAQTTFATTRGELTQVGSTSADEISQETLWPWEQLQLDALQQEDRPLFGQDTLQSIWTDVESSIEAPYELVKAGDNSTTRPMINNDFAKRRRGRPRLYPSPTGLNDFDVTSDTVPELRKSQLEKNRLAAEKCRRRRKEYIAGLLAEASTASSKNEALKAEVASLREELLNIKNEILRHAGCGSPIIDGYIARTAGTQLNAEATSRVLPRRDSGQESSDGRSDVTPKDPATEKESAALSNLDKPSFNMSKYVYDVDVFELLDEFVHTGEDN
ncbi:hypothetical protein C7974DRAFT_92873 [Boeremia exigua]|uniref:uncharacterized protein n=1 Tax=Boeremia exigua TaxID=749465 RepID=UPI001E8DD05D|nr:uncharacterized protein C7974DRAFT_92873 [Boeremia exigua]KAH6641954.1 hypothetical protein C7974DRAFT_92873 [Boeremia exigua]